MKQNFLKILSGVVTILCPPVGCILVFKQFNSLKKKDEKIDKLQKRNDVLEDKMLELGWGKLLKDAGVIK